MALARALAVALVGLQGRLVEVQCDIAAGLPGLSFTGRADASVVESRDRVRSALANSGLDWPNRRMTVALLPADDRKIGSRFDLAVGLAILAAAGTVPMNPVAEAVWIAELGLDGRLRPVRGVLPAVLAARDQGARRVVVAAANGAEAALVDDMDVRVADCLSEVVAWLTGTGPALPAACRNDPEDPPVARLGDLADVAGQTLAKRAIEIAAAGGHHVYLVGPPGAGKTMLAERLPGILPTLDDASSLEATAIHSVAGALGRRPGLLRRPPLQAPHHTASVAALVGGGSSLARPGAISLAHRGVLFLDEAPEFATRALDALREPLETGWVVLHRAAGAVTYPARFQLVLAANPCGCGLRAADCRCAPAARRRHEQRLSGPLMDRIDLRVEVEAVAHAELYDDMNPRESTAEVAHRVRVAREVATTRLAGTPWRLNAEIPGTELRSGDLALSRAATAQAESQLSRGLLSARGFDRTLRLSWTIADLNGHPVPNAADVGEALFFRTGQSQGWAA